MFKTLVGNALSLLYCIFKGTKLSAKRTNILKHLILNSKNARMGV